MKRQVLIVVPSLTGRVTAAISEMTYQAGLLSLHEAHPFAYTYKPIPAVRPIDYARNAAVEAFLATDAERLFMVDDDMEPPENWWALLLHDHDIVSGRARNWQAFRSGDVRSVPVLMHTAGVAQPDGTYRAVSPEGREVDACGAGCLVLSRRACGLVDRPWFKTQYNERTGRIEMGEDFSFFKKANAVGLRPFVDTNVRFGHRKWADCEDIDRYGKLQALAAVAELMGREAFPVRPQVNEVPCTVLDVIAAAEAEA